MAFVRPTPNTTWPREKAQKLVDEQLKPHYQRIELPYGLATKGSDRTPSSDAILPDDLTGKSVLDIGCQIGHFSHDSAHRGAARVLGVDVNPGAIAEATQIADCLGHTQCEFKLIDIERETIDEQFDYVLCLNVIQHFKNPLGVLEKLIENTREQLILELPSFGPRDCKKMRLSRYLGKLLDYLPVMYAGETGVNGRHYSPKFGITHKALKNMLLYHRNTFARVAAKPSQFKQRYFAFAHKRRFGRLVLLAGPPASGKSTLMRKLVANENNQVAEKLDIRDDGAWTTTNAADMHGVTEPKIDRLMMHYSFINPYVRRCRTYERDEFLDPLDLADELTILTLWCDPKVNLQRFDAHKIEPRTVNGEYKGSDRYLDRRSYLEDPATLIGYYRTWFEYVQRRGIEPLILDNTDGVKFLTFAEWESSV